MTKRTAVASLVLVSAIGCGGSDQRQAEEAAKEIQQGAEAMQKGAEQMAAGAQANSDQLAQGLQQMAQGFQQMAQGRGNVVDYEALKALLPQVDGWSQSNARGEQVSAPVKLSKAEARYQKGDSTIQLEITDTAMSQLLLAPMSMFLASGYSERSDDGFKRAAKVGGHPGIEDWNVGSKRGEVTAVVANRFIVSATGRRVDDIAAVRQVVEAVDLSKLASLE